MDKFRYRKSIPLCDSDKSEQKKQDFLTITETITPLRTVFFIVKYKRMEKDVKKIKQY